MVTVTKEAGYYKTWISILLFVFLYFPLFSTFSAVKGNVKKKGSNVPLEKVKVTVVFIKNPLFQYDLYTDERGNFYKSRLQPGMYRIAFDKKGFVPVQSTFHLLKTGERELNILLEALQIQTSNLSFFLLTEADKLLAVGNYEGAAAKISLAIEKDPNFFLLYYHRALGYEKKGDKENAIKDYNKSLELKPDFLLAITALGDLYAKQEDYTGAAAYYRKAFFLGITDPFVLYNYGACLGSLGNNSGAKAVFGRVIFLDPFYADAYYRMGMIHLGFNDNAGAKEYLEKFVYLDPGNSNAPAAKEILKALE